MSTATTYDFTPAQFRRTTQRQPPAPQTQHTPSIFSDMADGVLALDYAQTFAGLGYDARQLNLSIVGLLGEGQTTLEMYDEELANHLNCSVRTVRRWRAANIKETQKKNFGFLEITEGEYDSERKRYMQTKYRFTCPEFIDAAVNEARQSNEYQRDRRAALEKAAANHYEEIPEAPPRQRTKKPRPSATLKIERDFINAAKNIAKGRNTLNELPGSTRAAFMAGNQGEQLRALLAEMQQEIAGILQDFPQCSDNKGFEYIPDILAGIPPVAEDAFARHPGATPQEAQEARADETRVRVEEEEEEETRTLDLEVWNKTFAVLSEPQIRRVEVELNPPEPIEPPHAEAVGLDQAEVSRRTANFEEEGVDVSEHFKSDSLSDLNAFDAEAEVNELALKLETLISAQAKERQRTSAPGVYGGKPLVANLPQAVQGETRDELATIAGVAHGTIQKGKHTIELEYHADEAEPVAAFEIGVLVLPVASDGTKLHTEPSPVAERRLTTSGWQYRLDGFTQWRDERLHALHMEYVE